MWINVTGRGGDQVQPPVHPFSDDLNEGRDAADGASTGTEFQSRIADQWEEGLCKSVSVLDRPTDRQTDR